jgi:hypothetical protein
MNNGIAIYSYLPAIILPRRIRDHDHLLLRHLKTRSLFVPVPLMMAYITRYIFGTDKLRPNAFEVRGMNGANTGVIHSNDLAILSNWIKLISDNINILTTKKVALWLR